MKSDKVIKAGIGYTIGNYLLKGLSFFTIPIFARILSTEDYGVVNIFGAYESFLFVIVGLAIHSSFKNARYKYRYEGEGAVTGEDYGTYVSNSYLLICINGGLCLILAFVFLSFWIAALKINRFLITLLVVNSTANAIVTAYNSDASLNYEYKKFLKISYFNAIGNIVCSLVMMFTVFKDEQYEGRIVGTVLPITLASICILIKQFIEKKPKNFSSMMRWGVKYSIPIVPHGISQIVLSSFDRIMIGSMVSSDAAGVYSFAYNVFVIVQVTAASIDAVWNPWFYEQREVQNFALIKRVSSIYIFFLLAFSSIVMLLSPELVKILGGMKYRESVACVIPIICGGFFTFLYNIPVAVEYYHEKTNYISIATICAACINIVTNYIFIEIYGYMSAAYTTLGTYFLYFTFHYFIAIKIEGKSLFSVRIIWGASFIILIIALIAGLTINCLVMRILLCLFCIIAFALYADKKTALVYKLQQKLLNRRQS